ncbi:MAG: preprotein translocase subunit SecG [Rubripirellula sp.]
MNFLLLGGFANGMLGFLMAFLSLFLIMLILIQRGKGGGLTGALGGPGGQSAFGSKAGDTFTVVTVVVASIWGFTCAFAMWLNVESGGDALDPDQTAAVQEAGDDGSAGAGIGAGAETNTNTEPMSESPGGELTDPSIGAPADTAKPADAPADTAKPADAPAETAKPADAPADTAKPADAPAETDSGEAADANADANDKN